MSCVHNSHTINDVQSIKISVVQCGRSVVLHSTTQPFLCLCTNSTHGVAENNPAYQKHHIGKVNRITNKDINITKIWCSHRRRFTNPKRFIHCINKVFMFVRMQVSKAMISLFFFFSTSQSCLLAVLPFLSSSLVSPVTHLQMCWVS